MASLGSYDVLTAFFSQKKRLVNGILCTNIRVQGMYPVPQFPKREKKKSENQDLRTFGPQDLFMSSDRKVENSGFGKWGTGYVPCTPIMTSENRNTYAV